MNATAIDMGDNRQVVYVDGQAALESCMATLSKTPGGLLALDTEFERRKTFYPKTGLLQLADSTTCYLIDPLKVSDWTSFTDLLQNPALRFIVHAAGEDLNLLVSTLKCLPRNIIDTQIAAALLGLGYNRSYQMLMEDLLKVRIDKEETCSDWLQRPLSEEQLRYAALDVIYLHQAWSRLEADLHKTGRLGWLEEECERALSIAAAVESPDRWGELFAEVRAAAKMSDSELQSLQRLCIWREATARKKDLPRSWVAKDPDIVSIVFHHHRRPQTPPNENNCPDADRRFLRRYGFHLMNLLAEDESDSSPLPPPDRSLIRPKETTEIRSVVKACQKAVAARAEAMNIAPELLAPKRQLLRLLQQVRRGGAKVWPGVLEGWRAEVLADDLKPVLKSAAETLSKTREAA